MQGGGWGQKAFHQAFIRKGGNMGNIEQHEVYGMKLHETATLNDGTSIIRVPGGWIYTIAKESHWLDSERTMVYSHSSVFVPNNMV